jgi:hypothetical protein
MQNETKRGDRVLRRLTTHRVIPTVFYLTDVAHNDVADLNLLHLSFANRCKPVLVLDLTLKPAKLFLLLPVVEGRDEYNDEDRKQNGGALNPRMFLFFVVIVCGGINSHVQQKSSLIGHLRLLSRLSIQLGKLHYYNYILSFSNAYI